MTMPITFPANPAVGQEFLPDNGVTYNWTGSYWSSAVSVQAGRAFYTAVGGNATTDFDTVIANEIGGGGANP